MVLENVKRRIREGAQKYTPDVVKRGLEKVDQFHTKVEDFAKKHDRTHELPSSVNKVLGFGKQKNKEEGQSKRKGGKGESVSVGAIAGKARRVIKTNTETHTKLPNATRKTKAKKSDEGAYRVKHLGGTHDPLESTAMKSKKPASKKKEKPIYIGGIKVR